MSALATDPGLSLVGLAAVMLALTASLAPRPQTRAICALAALVAAPLLVALSAWDTAAVAALRDRPLLLVAGLLVAAIAALGLGRLTRDRPALLALLAIAALPFRIPLELGGQQVSLLIPLYLAIGVAAIAHAVSLLTEHVELPQLRRQRADEGVPLDEWRLDAEAEQAPPAAPTPKPEPAGERPASPWVWRKPGLLEWALAAFVLLYAVQALYSTDATHASQNEAFFLVPFALLWGQLRSTPISRALMRRCLEVITIVALVLAAIAFYEYATRELLFNTRVEDANQLATYFRVNALFYDPNILGRFLALVVVLLAASLAWARRSSQAAASTVAAAVLLCALVLTFSISSLVSLGVGLAVIAALRYGGGRTLAVCAAVVAVGLVAVVAFPGTVNVKLDSTDSLNQLTSGRVDLISGGLDLAAERPINGWGSGSFAAEYRDQRKGPTSHAVSVSHTYPVTVAAEQGVVGALAYFALVILAMLVLLRGASRNPARAAIAAAFVALVVHTLVYASFIEDPAIWVLLAFGGALAPAGVREAALQRQRRAERRAREAAALG